MSVYVIGDIHGADKALKQCIERSPFKKNNDTLIALGDVCDGWPGVRNAIEELLAIKHLIYILGNHDKWALDWFVHGLTPFAWLSQGGNATIQSYKHHEDVPQEHIRLFKNAKAYYCDTDDFGRSRLFTHGGFDWHQNMSDQSDSVLRWDRDLIHAAYQHHHVGETEWQFGAYGEIFIGHTPTLNFAEEQPTHYCNVWNLDTGAGWKGRLTIMNATTKQYWQSDLVSDLYPEDKGRMG